MNQINPKPKISVVIPSYNRAEFIAETLDSILAQTYIDFELVFVDDGSTDNTAEIVQTYTFKDKRVKYYHQENSERAVARSYGISLARGEYICLVDSDDTWSERKLEKQIEIMDANPEIVFCYASVDRMNMQGEPVKAAARQHEGFSGDIYFKLLERNFIPSVTPMFRREIAEKVGSQVTEFIPYEDWDFWLRMSRLGKFHHIKEPLGFYRLHPGQSVQNVKAEKIEEVTIKVLDANTEIDDESVEFSEACDRAYSLAYLRLGYWYILAGNSQTARDKLKLSWDICLERKYDLRWYGLFIFSYLNSFAPTIVKSFLGSFH